MLVTLRPYCGIDVYAGNLAIVNRSRARPVYIARTVLRRSISTPILYENVSRSLVTTEPFVISSRETTKMHNVQYVHGKSSLSVLVENWKMLKISGNPNLGANFKSGDRTNVRAA